MTIVVADTSPLNYLVLIGEIDLLPALYGKIVIPLEVFGELTHPDAPLAVGEWIRQAPTWLEIRRNLIGAGTPLIENLDAGECAAIQLAQSEEKALLLMDDAAGRRVADRLGIAQIGTLGSCD